MFIRGCGVVVKRIKSIPRHDSQYPLEPIVDTEANNFIPTFRKLVLSFQFPLLLLFLFTSTDE